MAPRFGRFANLCGSVTKTTHDAPPQITTARGTQERQPPQFSLYLSPTRALAHMDRLGLHALDSALAPCPNRYACRISPMPTNCA
jgi:hypothetical protein